MVTQIRTPVIEHQLPLEAGTVGRGWGRLLGARDALYLYLGGANRCVWQYAKSHWAAHLKFVHFSEGKLDLNKKERKEGRKKKPKSQGGNPDIYSIYVLTLC